MVNSHGRMDVNTMVIMKTIKNKDMVYLNGVDLFIIYIKYILFETKLFFFKKAQRMVQNI
jgi:hypothetical protein